MIFFLIKNSFFILALFISFCYYYIANNSIDTSINTLMNDKLMNTYQINDFIENIYKYKIHDIKQVLYTMKEKNINNYFYETLDEIALGPLRSSSTLNMPNDYTLYLFLIICAMISHCSFYYQETNVCVLWLILGNSLLMVFYF